MPRITNHESPITPSEIWTVVPARGVADGKSRLAGVLDASARAQLNRVLLTHTLEVVARWGGLDRCVVISPCEEALATAARLGAASVPETPGARGLNGAAALGASYASDHGAGSVLILACDLPYLSSEALAAIVHIAQTPRHFVIAPDKTGTGTNALLVAAERPFEFRFGAESFAQHLLLAAERGWTAGICSRPELEFDLDTPEDLAGWSGRAGGVTEPLESR